MWTTGTIIQDTVYAVQTHVLSSAAARIDPCSEESIVLGGSLTTQPPSGTGHIDDRIDAENRGPNIECEFTQSSKVEIELLLKEKSQWVKAILAQDLHILSSVEKEKSSIITELRSTKRAKKVVGAYHSGTQQTQLDEEA